jgi:hypothetical protein
MDIVMMNRIPANARSPISKNPSLLPLAVELNFQGLDLAPASTSRMESDLVKGGFALLTVGQLARIFNVSAKTIRHYDAVGLFTPLKVGEDNQYRFYLPEQLPELRRILFFRSMGLGIEVIRDSNEMALSMTPRR